MDSIYSHLTHADLFISVGTSGHVYPAAGFVEQAALYGAHTVEINLAPSQVQNQFAEAHYGKATQVLPEYVDSLISKGFI
jgi:NAD-dependent deacetylase